MEQNALPSRETAPRKTNSILLQIVFSLAAILLSALLLFVSDVEAKTLCYIFCGALMVTGVVAILSFFLTGSFRRLRDFSFSLGVMLILLGLCGLLQLESLAARFGVFMGFASLALGTVILQSTVQLRVLGHPFWAAELALTVITLLGAVLTLCEASFVLSLLPRFPSISLLISGIASLASLALVSLGLRAGRETPPQEKKEE